MKTILTITLNPTVDKSTVIDQLIPEKKLRCEQPKFEPGGGGINVSRGLKRLGSDSVALFPSGGRTGKLLEELLKKENVNQHSVEVIAETRENFIAVASATNQQYRFGMPGSAISQNEQNAIYSAFESLNPFPQIIVISGSLPPGIEPDFLRKLIKAGKAKGAKVVVDTSEEALKHAVEEGVFLLKPNLGELGRLVGRESLDDESADEAARELINAGKTEVIVVSLGPQGAYLITKDINEHIPAPTVKKLSTVGAGDSMVAGMVSVLAKGGSYQEMVRMGVACGSAATMNAGTQLFKQEDAFRLFNWLMSRQ
ncbi:1-phosphofructokinase family hexose kinase [Paradesertivirga mongoliensis]|uniref:1-phosphofructokinase family hexose kinase n=1 Tax=Paradesertivirga mongoliensis TaxID=2100740 RepID=A0ABW4ZRP5_9SPHI|nr:1-phosphofructokinase family hexose kinase [Pedobacter mongoliensis]